jgi:hypothetical protein
MADLELKLVPDAGRIADVLDIMSSHMTAAANELREYEANREEECDDVSDS